MEKEKRRNSVILVYYSRISEHGNDSLCAPRPLGNSVPFSPNAGADLAVYVRCWTQVVFGSAAEALALAPSPLPLSPALEAGCGPSHENRGGEGFHVGAWPQGGGRFAPLPLG